MDEHMVRSLMSTVDLITSTLDTDPNAWADQLQTIRNITASLEFLDTTPDHNRIQWQLPLIRVFQRVAFADADNGGVLDVANWCLRQSLTLLLVYPDSAALLTLVGQNWLQRAQKSLSKIHHNEGDSSSSGTSMGQPLSRSEEQRLATRASLDAEDRLHTADYVEARGILLPATEYLNRAVASSRTQNNLTGDLLAMAAEAFMSLGNVSSSRVNEPYYHQALDYLCTANEIADYALPTHLKQYLEEYGPLAMTE